MNAENKMANTKIHQLDRMEKVSGLEFDKNSAWEKLYGRLHGPKSNKQFVLWMSAACIVFSFLIVLFLNRSRAINSIHAINKEKKNDLRDAVRNSDKKNVFKTEILPVITRLTLLQPEREKKEEKNKWKQQNVNFQKQQLSNRQDLTLIPNQSTDTVITKREEMVITPAAIVQRKLKVVHNNELGMQQEISTPEEENYTSFGVIPRMRIAFYTDADNSGKNNKQSFKTKRSILGFSSLNSQKE